MGEVKIYTRKGDDGTTGLWYGGRVPKDDARTSAYGDVDEAISTIAVARSLAREAGTVSPVHDDLLELQRCMFIGCASLATLPEHHGKLEAGVTRLTDAMVSAVETRIDWYKERVELPPKFIIPGGTTLSAQLDVARTVTRRAERTVVGLKASGGLPDDTVLRYLNRASDLLFVIARYTDEPEPVIFEGRG
ncbi:MAG: cob(I)yrinic acid a,c-diamide adenosyltransferase [Actinobacteria bacterium]|nr:cob(I)yrinic acid a,c-diamide adenosyltransferase [Actinomycetota bacterium]